MAASWISLGVPSAALFVDGESRFRGLQGLGCDPGRCATADGFIPSFAVGVYFNSSRSQWAMGSLRLELVLAFFLGGDGRRRGGQALVVPVCEGSRDIAVIFFFFRVLCDVWLGQPYLYPLWAYIYSYVYVHLYLYVFLT
jgi:hypothetical protein